MKLSSEARIRITFDTEISFCRKLLKVSVTKRARDGVIGRRL
jgi:hypothetical protein